MLRWFFKPAFLIIHSFLLSSHCYLERDLAHNTYFQKCDEITLVEEPLSPLDLAIIVKGENISTLEPEGFLNKNFQAEVVPAIFFKYQVKEKNVKFAQDLGMNTLTALSFAIPGTVMVRAIIGGKSLVAIISGTELLGNGLSEVANTKECATYLTKRYGQARATTIMGTMHSFSLLSGNLNAPVKAASFADEMIDIAKKLPYEDVNVFAKAAGEIEQNAETLIKNGSFTKEQVEKIKNTNKFVRSDFAKVGKTVGIGEEIAETGKWLNKFEGMGLSDDLVKRLAKKFDDLGFREAQVDGFISDIVKGGDEFVLGISKNEGLAEAWKVLGESADLRKNIDALETIEYYTKNVNGNVDELTDAFKTASNKEDWFSGIIAEIRSKARNLPGTSKGNGFVIEGQWMRGTEGNIGLFPKQIADKLKGRQFQNFDEFRSEFWKTVTDDAELFEQFGRTSKAEMLKGNAPFALESQQVGGRIKYEIHHKTPIHDGGEVYDIDNLVIVTPRYHKEILDPAYHFKK